MFHRLTFVAAVLTCVQAVKLNDNSAIADADLALSKIAASVVGKAMAETKETTKLHEGDWPDTCRKWGGTYHEDTEICEF